MGETPGKTIDVPSGDVTLPEGTCSRCGRKNPSQNMFCTGCGAALRELEIRDHRSELMDRRPLNEARTIMNAPQMIMRRTMTSLAAKSRSIMPIAGRVQPLPRRDGGMGEKKSEDVALVVGVAILAALFISAIVLVVLLLHYL
jgi:hypothetical protein